MTESDSTTVYNSRHTSSMLSNSSQIMSDQGPFTFVPPEFGSNELSPYITEKVMVPHLAGHEAIVIKLNELIGKDVDFNNDLHNPRDEQLSAAGKKIYLQEDIKFFGGGHIIHSLFWENLAPVGWESGIESEGAGEIKQAISAAFGDYEQFKTAFITAANGIHGNGWGWLGLKKLPNSTHLLEIVTTHDSDLPPESYIPIIGIDAAEHAYLLDKDIKDVPGVPDNVKDFPKLKYLHGIWNVINFVVAQERYNAAIGK